MDIDFEELAALVALLKEADFTDFTYEKGDVRIQVRRGGNGADPAGVAPLAPVQAAAGPVASPVQRPAPTQSVSADAIEGALAVTAPMLGTFYASPKPGEPAFVKVGDRVEPDTVLCIVEVMKLMNSVHAGVRGVVAGVHASNGDLVEFGQPLFSVIEEEAS